MTAFVILKCFIHVYFFKGDLFVFKLCIQYLQRLKGTISWTIERVHIKFCKLLLQLKNSDAHTYDLQRVMKISPIVLDVKIRILSFWS
jgi:hypothetical protein